MKFEIIFEDDGTYGAAISMGKESIFTIGENQADLLKNIKEAVECVFEKKEKLTQNNRKLVKFLKQYLIWRQNSVFEGEISESQLKEIEKGISEIIGLGDSVIIYHTKHLKEIKSDVIGFNISNFKLIV